MRTFFGESLRPFALRADKTLSQFEMASVEEALTQACEDAESSERRHDAEPAPVFLCDVDLEVGIVEVCKYVKLPSGKKLYCLGER